MSLTLRAFGRYAVIVVASWFAFYVVCGILARQLAVREATKGRDLLLAMERVSGGKSSANDLIRLATRYDGHIEGVGCTDEQCEVRFQRDNRWLNRLRLAPLTTLDAGVTLSHRQTTRVFAGMFVVPGRHSSGDVAALAITDLIPDGLEPLTIIFRGAMIERKAFCQINSGANASQRQMAFAYDVSCLYRLGGCRDSTQLVPEWWNQWQRRPVLLPDE